MRTSAAAGCALAVTAVLVGTAGCGTTHHAHTAMRARARTKATAKALSTPRPSPTQNAAARAVTAMVERVDAKRSARIVSTQEHTSGTVVMTGVQSWGSSGAGLDLTVPPIKIGMERLNRADRMEIRCLGGAEYVRIDPAGSGPLKGKRWLRYTGATMLGSDAADTTDRVGEQSPVDFLRASAAAGGVTLVGRETMAGKPTTHYRGTFSTDPALQKRGVPATAEFDLYVGDDGLPVTLVRNFQDEFTTTGFQGFGGARPVAGPPAAQTADMSAELAATTRTST